LYNPQCIEPNLEPSFAYKCHLNFVAGDVAICIDFWIQRTVTHDTLRTFLLLKIWYVQNCFT